MSLTTANIEAEAALLRRGRGIVANPAFFFIFTLVAAMALVVLSVVGISGLAGWIMAGVVLALGAVGYFTGLGDRMLVLGVALLALASGVVLAIVVAILLFGGAEQPTRATSGEHSSIVAVASNRTV